jgi:hypothetical protein
MSLTCLRGANTDLLGRRWFLVGGNLICFVGHITVGTAKTTNAIIAGMAITGFGAANCQMAAFALTELLPNKWRHIGEYSPVNLCVSSSYRYQLNSLQVLLSLMQQCIWQSLSFRLQLVMGT